MGRCTKDHPLLLQICEPYQAVKADKLGGGPDNRSEPAEENRGSGGSGKPLEVVPLAVVKYAIIDSSILKGDYYTSSPMDANKGPDGLDGSLAIDPVKDMGSLIEIPDVCLPQRNALMVPLAQRNCWRVCICR